MLLLAGVAGTLSLSAALAQPRPQIPESDGPASAVLPVPAAVKKPPYSPTVGAKYPQRVYWGDTHLHTRCSADAYSLGTHHVSAADAFRFARGEEVTSETGWRAKLKRPLDFLAVTDHAEYLGAVFDARRGTAELLRSAVGKRWSAYLVNGEDRKLFAEFAAALNRNSESADAALPDAYKQYVWDDVTSTADRYYEPGRFTTFSGYEWSSAINGNNLHRVVLFRDPAHVTRRVLPFSSLDSQDPEDLWKALEHYERTTGGRALAIPHNANLSNGMMFAPATVSGAPLTAEYARRRMRWEPLLEVTQIKGDSETHPLLSTDDEFAAYERWDKTNIAGTHRTEAWMLPGNYARSALQLGLKHEAALGANPFKFGMIGSTDSHTGLATTTEDNFYGKFPGSEPSPTRMTAHMAPGFPVPGAEFAASGLAAVWATDNTREALFDAMERKEVYATTGTRITVRLFGGWSFTTDDLARADFATVGYAKGVPMGGDLTRGPKGGAPMFMVAASKDPDEANLDRIQIVKGWLDEAGNTRETIYDVALSNGRRVDPKTGKAPSVGNTVDVENATYSNSIGAEHLAAIWTDPEFDPARRAVYYARVLEIPTPRWTAYDVKRFASALPPGTPAVTVERAYTSPIWYQP
jgi:hypothetical protein